MSEQIDWTKFGQKTEALQQANEAGKDFKNPFFKFPVGVTAVRFLPEGNYAERLPFRSLVRHSVTTMVGGQQKTDLVICFNWLLGTPDVRSSLAQMIGKKGLMSQKDFDSIKAFGCPFCNVQNALQASGAVDKQTVSNLRATETYLWNVLVRSQIQNNPDQVYVWGMSKTHHTTVSSMVANGHNQGMQVLDPNIGYDWNVTATGTGLSRRYTLLMMPLQKPIGMAAVPFDLNEIASLSYKGYQDAINILLTKYGEVLNQINYKIPGNMGLVSETPQPVAAFQPAQQPPPVASQFPSPTVFQQPSAPVPTAVPPSAPAYVGTQPPWEQPTAPSSSNFIPQGTPAVDTPDGGIVIDGIKLY